ncbi:hypothetical protein [Bacillus alkalicellulosilyticus]|uniref:hypothetical protein n=1 Tax=Alkalihalobacterium alkalicellulosilyticum TaxID=1912214 RepID=UPI0009988996
MAQLIAMKNKAASAINGDVSSDGLSAMLGDDGDLQSMLIKSIKKGEKLKGSTEEWVAQTSNRARELLSGIGKKKQRSAKDQFIAWVKQTINTESTLNVLLKKADSISANIEKGKINGFHFNNGVLEIDLIEAFGFDMVADGAVLSHLVSCERKPASTTSSYQLSIFDVEPADKKANKTKKSQTPVQGQLVMSLF